MRKINQALVGVSVTVAGNMMMVLDGSFLTRAGDGIMNADIIFFGRTLFAY